MAAGLGFKDFTTGEVLTAADVDGYLMQNIWVFASTAARDAAVTAPSEGNFAFTKDTDSLWYYNGAAWVASGATGDIEGVTAGIGISGGGTSGTVTVTNSMATAIDAKGDLIVGTGADTFSKLSAGTNGYLLTADSAEATGLKWAAAASGSTFVGCSLYDTNLTQSIANSTNVALTWNSEYFDTDGYHNNSTNTSRITIPSGKGGKYLLTGATHYSTGSTGYRAIKFKKNGGDFFDINYGAAGAYTGLPITAIVELSVGDYVELITVQNSGGSLDAYKYTAPSYGWFAAQYLGA
jgi:hypothetical protein